jgi:hypothetical protein
VPHVRPCVARRKSGKSPLAREGNEAIVAARVAVKTGKSRGQTPAREELSKLALNESRQAFLLAQRGCLCAKRLKMITNDVIENTLGWIARLVSTRCRRHSLREGGHHASCRCEKSRVNRASRRSPAAVPAIPSVAVDRNSGHPPDRADMLERLFGNIDDSARFTAARSAATRGSGASAELSPSAGSAFAFLISNMPYPTT